MNAGNSYLQRLQAEKVDLEQQLKALTEKTVRPWVGTPGGRDYTTQERIEAVSARLAQVETDIKRETERKP
jgi:hypothetical protein